ncbi:hypothetical protein E5D57_004644 [Metarhizium anisopliae]|nr:hypothetical protein E5D57_004644 [Metarhizium anisopliae]
MASHRTLFGGPAQPTPVDERGGIRAASRKAAESESVCSPNQYQNDDVSFAAPDGCDENLTTRKQNWKAHVRWTGPQIHKQLPNINVIAASMGTSGTTTPYFSCAS